VVKAFLIFIFLGFLNLIFLPQSCFYGEKKKKTQQTEADMNKILAIVNWQKEQSWVFLVCFFFASACGQAVQVEVGLCSFQRAEAACNELCEPFKDGTKWFPHCIKMHKALVMFPARWLKQEGEVLRAVPLWKLFPK